MDVVCPHCGAPRKGPSCPYCGVVFGGGGKVPVGGAGMPPGMPPGVLEALRSGNKIGAIRLYHKAMKCSLLEAKQAVEALAG